MEISIHSSAYYGEGYNRLDKMKEHGYDCVDFNIGDIYTPLYQKLTDEEYFDYMRKVKADFDAAGIEIFQVHGPDCFPPPNETEEKRQWHFELKAKAIKACPILGCKYLVTHCIAPWNWNGNPDPQLLWDINKDFFARLAKVGEEYGVTVCLETLPWPDLNVTKPEDIKRLIEEIDSPYFQACLDTGHCNAIKISPAEAARTLGKYIKTTHIHDNDAEGRDRHWIPYVTRDNKTNWAELKEALREIGYEGTINLECTVDSKQIPEHLKERYEIGLAMIAKDIASGL